MQLLDQGHHPYISTGFDRKHFTHQISCWFKHTNMPLYYYWDQHTTNYIHSPWYVIGIICKCPLNQSWTSAFSFRKSKCFNYTVLNRATINRNNIRTSTTTLSIITALTPPPLPSKVIYAHITSGVINMSRILTVTWQAHASGLMNNTNPHSGKKWVGKYIKWEYKWLCGCSKTKYIVTCKYTILVGKHPPTQPLALTPTLLSHPVSSAVLPLFVYKCHHAM